MLKAGQTILLPKPGQDTAHLWVVVVSVNEKTNETVIVNLTTQRTHSDTTVVLQKGEHPFVQHPTVVHYIDARIIDAKQLERAIEAGTFRSHSDCTQATLQRIQEGLFTSPFTPQKVKLFAGKILSRY